MRGCTQATLATLTRPGGDRAGWPSPSLALIGFATDGCPLLLISGLAEHTRNLLVDPRCGLLFDGTAGHIDRLTGPRLSVRGQAEPTQDPALLRRFLTRQPTAVTYAGFGDFGLWRVVITDGHLVAGFGRIHTLSTDDLCLPATACEYLARAEAELVAHMNQDHADALALYATALLGKGHGRWCMTGLDPDGLDLRTDADTARLAFTAPVYDVGQAHTEMMRLATLARTVSP
nr:DUF2470 domain-containing protein [Niveispirillum lacus]